MRVVLDPGLDEITRWELVDLLQDVTERNKRENYRFVNVTLRNVDQEGYVGDFSASDADRRRWSKGLPSNLLDRVREAITLETDEEEEEEEDDIEYTLDEEDENDDESENAESPYQSNASERSFIRTHCC